MIIKILQEISKQDGNVFDKIKKLREFKGFHKNLQDGIKSQRIFHNLENQNSDLVNLIHNFDGKDFELFNKLFNIDVKEFLRKTNFKKNLEFQKRERANQIGVNTIFVEKPVMGLWTTGRATFYIPTKKNQENKVIINLQSIVPLNVEIKFDDQEIYHENMTKLATKKIELTIPSSLVSDSVSEISINTDKLWLPNVILGIKESVRLGIKIDSISVTF